MAAQSRTGFLEIFRSKQVVMVVGDADSGKTTQVPQWCLDEMRKLSPPSSEAQRLGKPQVVCAQPRRAAAASAASQVAEERGVALGEEVGYSIRFKHQVGPKTSLKYVTDGVLLREAGYDSLFESYACVILDELQERTAATDVLMGLMKQVLTKRSDLKVVLMTTTLGAGQFQSYFVGVPVVKLPGGSGAADVPDAAYQEQAKKIPEILKRDLLPVVLQLKMVGVSDPSTFGFIDPPALEDMTRAKDTLKWLGALDDSINLTKLGKTMAGFPLDPQLTKALIASCDSNCAEDVRAIISMLSIPPIAVGDEKTAARDLIDSHGDHLTLLNVYRAFKQSRKLAELDENTLDLLSRAEEIDLQLASIMNDFDLGQSTTETSAENDSITIRKALVAGFFMQVAYRGEDAMYHTIRANKEVRLHPTTCLRSEPDWVIYNEYVDGSERYIRTVTAIEPEWLLELAPRFFRESSLLHNDVNNRLKGSACKLEA